LSEGDAYADDFCKKDVFERNPGKLKKMIAQKSKGSKNALWMVKSRCLSSAENAGYAVK
jgi:hypothetical protein